MTNPFSAAGAYRRITKEDALYLCLAYDKHNLQLRADLRGAKWPESLPGMRKGLPRMGHEVGLKIEGREYWLANESGDYYFKHPDYEVKR